MTTFFPRQSVEWHLEEPAAFRRLSLSLVEMALATGIVLRLLRAFAARGGIPVHCGEGDPSVCLGRLGLVRVWQFARCDTTGLASGVALSRTREHATGHDDQPWLQPAADPVNPRARRFPG